MENGHLADGFGNFHLETGEFAGRFDAGRFARGVSVQRMGDIYSLRANFLKRPAPAGWTGTIRRPEPRFLNCYPSLRSG